MLSLFYVKLDITCGCGANNFSAHANLKGKKSGRDEEKTYFFHYDQIKGNYPLKGVRVYELDKPDNVVEIFQKSIARYPNRPLLGEKDKTGVYQWVSYQEFGKRVDNLRAGMSQLGITKGDRVGIISNNSINWVVTFIATTGLGAILVPMYENELLHIWKYIIADSEIKILFISRGSVYDKIKDALPTIPSLKHVILMEGDGTDSMAQLEKVGSTKPVKAIFPAASDLAVLAYTSGTTGNPKGVLLTHGNFSSNSHAVIKQYSTFFTPEERSLSILPWAHVFGLTEMITFANSGASVGLAESATTIVDDIVKVRPTLLIAVPKVFNRIYDGLWTKMNETGGLAKKLFVMGVESAKRKRELAAQGKSSLLTNLKFKIADKVVFSKIREKLGGRLKGVLTGSATMNVDISYFFWDIGVPLYDAYGLTETTPAATMNSPSRYRIGSVGYAIDKVKIVIDKSIVEPDATDGEVIVYGPNVMQGYYKKPEATKAVMTPDGGFRTGDRGRLDEDGFLFITGRIKEQFKLDNGKYVFPDSLEGDIKLVHFVEQAMIYGAGRPYTICLVVPDFVALKTYAEKNSLPTDPKKMATSRDITQLIETEIVKALKGKYGGYEIPKKFIFIDEPFTVDNGMITQTMKLKRRVVLEKFKDQIEKLYASPMAE
jgi:Long-chain acyl-CoA synthetases (AMP-forming)